MKPVVTASFCSQINSSQACSSSCPRAAAQAARAALMDAVLPKSESCVLWGICSGDDASWRSVVAVGEVNASFGQHETHCDFIWIVSLQGSVAKIVTWPSMLALPRGHAEATGGSCLICKFQFIFKLNARVGICMLIFKKITIWHLYFFDSTRVLLYLYLLPIF